MCQMGGRSVIDRKGFFLAAVFVLSLIFSAMRYLQGVPLLPHGPTFNVAEVTKSLWRAGSLRPERFDQIYRDAAELSRTTGSEVWQDVFALDIRGELAPKHSLVSSVLAVPFYALLGDIGFWVLQQLLVMWLLYSTYCIATRVAGRSMPLTTLVVTCLLSPVLLLSHGFSYDLHGCAFLIGGLNLMHQRPSLGAFLMSLSILVRPSYILLVCPLICALYEQTPQRIRVLLFRGAGAALGLVIFFGVNYLLWGDPFTTAYERLPGFRNGELFISPHPLGLDLHTFVGDWSAKLWGRQGILPFTPCVALLPLVLLAFRHQRERWFQGVCLFAALAYTLYIFSYPMWMVTDMGNRFLLAATFLFIPSCIGFVAKALPASR